MSDWNWTSLGALTNNFDNLRRPVKASDRQDGPIPYYGASGIIDWVNGYTHKGDFLLIAEDGENLRSRSTPIAFMARGKSWVNNHAHVVTGNSASDTRFLEYLFAVTDVTGYLTGSAQPKLSRTALDSIVVKVPSADEQRAIAEVLGALDDKIAANTRQSETLLLLADSEFALLARGFGESDQTFGDLATVSGGGTPKTKVDEYWGGDIRWATPTDVTGLGAPYLMETARKITDAGLESCSSRLYPAGSILMTSRATIGAFALAQAPTAVNQGFIVVNANDPTLQMWLFHEMRRRVPEFLSHANGATFMELSRGKFKALAVHLAEGQAMTEFGEVATALHEKGAALTSENASLAEARDTLLPLLMSGKVRVNDAEKTVEEMV